MNIITMALPGVLLLELSVHADARGVFSEVFVQTRYAHAGISEPFVQDNWSRSVQGVLRGLHIQPHYPQGKLITVLRGRIWDVVADVNPASPTFGQCVGIDLAESSPRGLLRQLWVPPGYAHGFCVLSTEADVFYKCTQTYHPEDDAGVLWSDPELAITWPLADPVVSVRDAQLPDLQTYLRRYALYKET